MSCYSTWIRPLFFQLDPELAHHLAMVGLDLAGAVPPARGLLSACTQVDEPALTQELFGCQHANPIGLAAGFDKSGAHIQALAALGFGHIEIGTFTAQAQPGNPRPRCFRLRQDAAIINRMGFNNVGSQAAGAHLKDSWDPRGGQRRPPCVLGINLGKSKACADGAELDDYRRSCQELAALADYLVVNVSCPNVPGVTGLQEAARLEPLLRGIRAELDAITPGCPLLLKIAPDLDDAAIDAAVDIARSCQLNGLIATNTSTRRSGLRSPQARIEAIGNGGLSGAPLRRRADAVLARVARRLRQGGPRLPLIGVGGVASPADAWRKIELGADLVQVYSGFIYYGPLIVRDCNRYCAKQLHSLGLGSISAAVGRNL